MVMMLIAVSVLVRVNVTILISMSMQYRLCIRRIASALRIVHGFLFHIMAIVHGMILHVITRVFMIPVPIWVTMGHNFAIFILMPVYYWIVWITFVVAWNDNFWSFKLRYLLIAVRVIWVMLRLWLLWFWPFV